jgi:hypothetical protein
VESREREWIEGEVELRERERRGKLERINKRAHSVVTCMVYSLRYKGVCNKEGVEPMTVLRGYAAATIV